MNYIDSVNTISDATEFRVRGIQIEQADMIMVSTKKTLEYLKSKSVNDNNDTTSYKYKITEMAYNAAGDVIGIRIWYANELPSWANPILDQWIKA
jgi:uncharacterized protein YuzE